MEESTNPLAAAPTPVSSTSSSPSGHAASAAAPANENVASGDAPSSTPEQRLHALETKMAQWKEAVAAQLNDAARKNKRVREEVRQVREERETALSALRVQLTEEFQERTAMQREELAEAVAQAARLREEKKSMAAAHESELQKMRVQLREVIQLEVETRYKRKEEQWEKERAALQARVEAKETERAQAEHEGEVVKMRLSRLGAQYEELATLLQPKDSGTDADGSRFTPGQQRTSPSGAKPAVDDAPHDATPQQHSAANAAFAQQLESIKAELQSKEQHTQFVLDRARQEHEAEKAQLLRELQLREEELKVAHTLLNQVQAESSGYLQRVSHAQTERQALEQRYAGKVAKLSEELAERLRAVDEAQRVSKRLQDQLRTAQQQVAMLEEESTMREEAFHSLMLSEDNKRLVMDLQKSVQAAKDEAEEWKLQYYTAVAAPTHASGAGGGGSRSRRGAELAGSGKALGNAHAAHLSGEDEDRVRSAAGSTTSSVSGLARDALLSTSGKASTMNSPNASSSAAASAAAAMGSARSPQAWQEQLTAREAALAAQAAQLERKAHLLEAAEVKLNDMRRSIAGQASLLLQQQNGRREQNSKSSTSDHVTFVDDEEDERDIMDASPIISTAASLLPSSMHGSLRMLEVHRRRLHLPGSCRCLSCLFSGGGTSGAPLRLRRTSFLAMMAVLLVFVLVISMRAIAGGG